MKFISKRVLAVLMTVVMLLGLLPVGGLFAAAETTELLTNGGFESGALDGSWYASRSTASVSTEQAHEGTYSAKISGTSIFAAPGSLTAGKTYVLSWWVYVPSGSTVQLQLYMAAAPTYTAMQDETSKYSLPISNNIAEYDTWVQYTREFVLPEGNTAMEVQLYSAVATDLYYIDDVSLKVKEEEPVEVNPTEHGGDTELVANAVSVGPADGTFSATGDNNNYVGNASKADGMAKIDVTGTDDYIQFNGVTVEAGKEYTLAFYVWIVNASDDFKFNVYMTGTGSPKGGWLDYVMSDTTYITSSTPAGNITADTGDWQRVAITWTAPNSGTATIGLKNYGSDATGVIYIDDVSVTYEQVSVLPTDHTAIAGPNLPEGKTNLIVNPSFTDNDTTGYSITDSTETGAVDNMLKIGTGYVQSPTNITLTAGKTYRLSYYVWVEESSATANIQIYMDGAGSANNGSWLDFAITNGGNTSGNALTGVTDAWVEQWIEWTAVADGIAYFGFKDYAEINYGTNDSTYYVDDICLYDVNETVAVEETIEIDFENEAHTVGVNYNSNADANRTWLHVTVGGATLPGDAWALYSGTATMDIDGASYTGNAQKLDSADAFQIYMEGNGINHNETASKITIPSGTAFTYADTANNINYTITFKNDFIIVKEDGVWVKYAPASGPSDHSTIGPNLPEDKTNLISFGDMSSATGFTITGDGAVENGMLKMNLSSTDDMAHFSVGITAGKTYRFSAYMWVTDAGGVSINGEASGHVSSYQTGIYSTSLKADTEGWVEMTYEFTATGTSLNLYFVRNYWGGDATVYVDDLCLYDVNEESKIYIDLAPNDGSVTLDEVGYNSGDFRSFIILETAATLPVADWATYTGSTNIDFGGQSVLVGFAGNNNANQFQIYVKDSTVTDDFSTTASEITIPADTQFSSGNTVVRITAAIKLVNNYGVWMIYDENAPTYTPIYAEDVSMFAAVDQGTRNVFGFEVDGVNIPFASSWANFGYFPIYVDEEEVSVAFGTTDTDATWGMGEENKFLVYTEDGVYSDAQEMIIPKGTILVHPADDTLAYLFTDDVVITKTDDGNWPLEVLLGAQVALGDTLKSAVTLRIPAALYVDGMMLQYTVDGNSATTVLTATGADQLYTATLSTAAKNVTDTYTLQLIDAYSNPVGASVEYSIADYAMYIVESFSDGNSTYTEEQAAAAVSLLGYAKSAQTYLGYKTDDPAFVGGLNEEGIEHANTQLAAVADMTASATDDTFVGCSLLLRDATAIRLYFSAQHEGTLSAANGLYYVDITGISAHELDDVFTAEVNGVTYQISVLSLCKKVVASDTASDNFKDLARMLYLYWQYADALANA